MITLSKTPVNQNLYFLVVFSQNLLKLCNTSIFLIAFSLTFIFVQSDKEVKYLTF